MKLTEHEIRILKYLKQRGPAHRHNMVCDLASPESRIGKGILNGSNSFIPAIAANWTRKLRAADMVRTRPSYNHSPIHDTYYISEDGHTALRERE